MHERGMSYSELARITGKSIATISSYISLMQKGEERLIRGVEEGLFTISFAIEVVENPRSEVQHFLMDAYLKREITLSDMDKITKILNEREEKGISNKDMTISKLTSIINKKTKVYKMLYNQGKAKRDDAIDLMGYLRELWDDEQFCKMVDGINDLTRPELNGQYGNIPTDTKIQ